MTVTDLRIIPSGSICAILDLDWLLDYCYVKLVGEASELGRNNYYNLIANIEAV